MYFRALDSAGENWIKFSSRSSCIFLFLFDFLYLLLSWWWRDNLKRERKRFWELEKNEESMKNQERERDGRGWTRENNKKEGRGKERIKYMYKKNGIETDKISIYQHFFERLIGKTFFKEIWIQRNIFFRGLREKRNRGRRKTIQTNQKIINKKRKKQMRRLLR